MQSDMLNHLDNARKAEMQLTVAGVTTLAIGIKAGVKISVLEHPSITNGHILHGCTILVKED